MKRTAPEVSLLNNNSLLHQSVSAEKKKHHSLGMRMELSLAPQPSRIIIRTMTRDPQSANFFL